MNERWPRGSRGSYTTSRTWRNPVLMMLIIPSLFSVIYWLRPACFHLYKGNSTRRFMYTKYLALRAPSKTLHSFWNEASPRQAVPSSGQGCKRSPLCRAPTGAGTASNSVLTRVNGPRRRMVSNRGSFHPHLWDHPMHRLLSAATAGWHQLWLFAALHP